MWCRFLGARTSPGNRPAGRAIAGYCQSVFVPQINSGLGEAAPLNIVVLPLLFESQVRAVIELASFKSPTGSSLPVPSAPMVVLISPVCDLFCAVIAGE
jgi:hypothetical protein